MMNLVKDRSSTRIKLEGIFVRQTLVKNCKKKDNLLLGVSL